MDEIFNKKVQNILASQHRDELIKGLIADLHSFIETDLQITRVVHSNKSDAEKVERIKELVMYCT
jgi:hypothetical protein